MQVFNTDSGNNTNQNNQSVNGIDSIQRRRYAYASNVFYDDLLRVGEEVAAEWRANKHEYEKIMHKGAYTKKITMCLKALGISSRKKEHIGRDTAPAIMDMEEVCGLDQRNMGNWAVDVYQRSYSKRLPLGALRALAGYSKEKGRYKNPRTTFKGEEEHEQLAKQIFPWVDLILSDAEINNHETSKGFLTFLSNMRWVILQDAAIFIKVHGRTHCLFDTFPHIFKSDLFEDYAKKVLSYMDEALDPNDINIEKVLPGVLQKFDQQNESLKEIKEDIDKLKCNMNRDNIKADMSTNIREELHLFSQHIGNAIGSYGTQNNRTLTNETVPNEQDTQQNNTDLISLHENNAIVTQEEGPCQTQITDVMESERIEVAMVDQYYIPEKFETVNDMIDHWNMCVVPRLTLHKSNWRKHLNRKDMKRFSRLKNVIDKINRLVDRGRNRDEVIKSFESYYSANKKIFSKLADVFIKTV